MAFQIGAINLLAIPFGALPMCHGAGGLAAHYRFGGRSGLSTILLGAMMVGAAILFGPGMVHLLASYPVSILAVMLILAGWTLGRVARDAMSGTDLMVLLATLLPILLVNTAIGFVAGLTVALVIGKCRPATRRE
jgi:MFS superfamily sulfate permease-like transporter